MKKVNTYLTAFILLGLSSGFAQENKTGGKKEGIIILDLDPVRAITNQTLEVGKLYLIRLINLRPDLPYSITVNHANTSISPIENPFGEKIQPERIQKGLTPPEAPDKTKRCDAIVSNFGNDITSAFDEAGIATSIVKARTAASGCSDDVKKALEKAIVFTIHPVYRGTIQEGDKITIKVENLSNDKSITFKLKTSEKSEWRTTYGFTFMPNEDEKWFTKQTEKSDEFIITRENEEDGMDFVASTVFTWHSARSRFRNVQFSPLGGLGFDLENPVVFAGLAITFRENISLDLGAVMHKQKHLAGQYVDLGTPLKTNLEQSALLEESYKPNYFVGLSYRFNSNPHKKSPSKPLSSSNSGGNGSGNSGDKKGGDGDDDKKGDVKEDDGRGKPEENKSNFFSAGVLPYSVKDNQTYALLGLDRERSYWLDFGGKKGVKEEPKQTAAREFFEEIREAYELKTIEGKLEGSTPLIHPFGYQTFPIEVSFIKTVDILSKPFLENTEKIDYEWVPFCEFRREIQKSEDAVRVTVEGMSGRKIQLHHWLVEILKELEGEVWDQFTECPN